MATVFPAWGQTAIVAVWTPDEIVIAADSKAVDITFGTQIRTERTVCKVFQSGNLFYTYSGKITRYAKSGFDVQQIVEQTLRDGTTIMTKAQNFERLVQGPLTQALEMVRQENPAYFEQELLRGDPVQVLIAGIENANLVLSVRGFKIISAPSVPVKLQISRIDCPTTCASKSTYVLMGNHDAIDRTLKADLTSNIWRHGLVSATSFLVSIEIFGTPDTVGPPIDILRITRSGAEWIQKKPECEERKESKPSGVKQRRI